MFTGESLIVLTAENSSGFPVFSRNGSKSDQTDSAGSSANVISSRLTRW